MKKNQGHKKKHIKQEKFISRSNSTQKYFCLDCLKAMKRRREAGTKCSCGSNLLLVHYVVRVPKRTDSKKVWKEFLNRFIFISEHKDLEMNGRILELHKKFNLQPSNEDLEVIKNQKVVHPNYESIPFTSKKLKLVKTTKLTDSLLDWLKPQKIDTQRDKKYTITGPSYSSFSVEALSVSEDSDDYKIVKRSLRHKEKMIYLKSGEVATNTIQYIPYKFKDNEIRVMYTTDDLNEAKLAQMKLFDIVIPYFDEDVKSKFIKKRNEVFKYLSTKKPEVLI